MTERETLHLSQEEKSFRIKQGYTNFFNGIVSIMQVSDPESLRSLRIRNIPTSALAEEMLTKRSQEYTHERQAAEGIMNWAKENLFKKE